MKHITITILFTLASLLLYGQADTVFVIGAEFGSVSVIDDSTFQVSSVHPADQLGQGFLPTQIREGYQVFDVQGRMFRVSSIVSANFGESVLQVVELQDNNIGPIGVGVIYRKPDDSNRVPRIPEGNTGLSPAIVAKIHNHNVMNGGGTGGLVSLDSIPADSVSLTDAGDYFAATDVEGALQEVGDSITDLRTDLTAIAAGASDGVATSGAYDSGNEEIDITVAAPGSDFAIDVSALATDSDVADSLAQVRSEIPENVSDLTNDAGYLTSETDAIALSALVDTSTAIRADIPVNVSELTNDAGYLTTEVDGSVTNELQDADEVSIDDAGGYYVGTEVETALQNVGATMTVLGNLLATKLDTATAVQLNDSTFIIRSYASGSIVNADTITISGIGGGTDDQTASEVPISDAGGFYTGTEVETALQEVGDSIATLRTDLTAIASGASDGVATSGTHDTVNEEIDITVAAPGSNFSVDISGLVSDTELADSTAAIRADMSTGPTYTAGFGIDISGSEISADTNYLATQSDLTSKLEGTISDSEVAYGSGGGITSNSLMKYENDVLSLYNNAPTVNEANFRLIGGTSINAINNRNIASIDFQSRDGFPSGKTSARIQAFGTNTHTGGNTPSGIRFWTTPTDSLITTASLDGYGNWHNTGNSNIGGNLVAVGGGDFGSDLNIDGDIEVSGNWLGRFVVQEETSATDGNGAIRIWSNGSLNSTTGVDHVGSIDFFSSDDGGSAGDFVGPKVASIEAYAGGSHNASANSTGLRFKVTDGTSYNTELTLSHAGLLGLSADDPGYALTLGDETGDNAAIRLFPHTNALTTTAGLITFHTTKGALMSNVAGDEMQRVPLYEDATPADGDQLVYNAANSRFELEQPSAYGTMSSFTVFSDDGLADPLTIEDADIITFSGGAGVETATSGSVVTISADLGSLPSDTTVDSDVSLAGYEDSPAATRRYNVDTLKTYFTPDADEVSIDDAGGLIIGTTVEAGIQENATNILVHDVLIAALRDDTTAAIRADIPTAYSDLTDDISNVFHTGPPTSGRIVMFDGIDGGVESAPINNNGTYISFTQSTGVRVPNGTNLEEPVAGTTGLIRWNEDDNELTVDDGAEHTPLLTENKLIAEGYHLNTNATITAGTLRQYRTFAASAAAAADYTMTLPTPSATLAGHEITIYAIDQSATYTLSIDAGTSNIRRQTTTYTDYTLTNGTTYTLKCMRTGSASYMWVITSEF